MWTKKQAQTMSNEHAFLNRSKLMDLVHNFRAWFLKTFFIPVKAQKCAHEYKMKGYNTYRVGKTKIVTMTHACTLCGIIKKHSHKY